MAAWPCSCLRLSAVFSTQQSLQLPYHLLLPPPCTYYLTFPFRSNGINLSSWLPGSIPINPCQQLRSMQAKSLSRDGPSLIQAICGSFSYIHKTCPRPQGKLLKLHSLVQLASWKKDQRTIFYNSYELMWYFGAHSFRLTEQMHECERVDLLWVLCS